MGNPNCCFHLPACFGTSAVPGLPRTFSYVLQEKWDHLDSTLAIYGGEELSPMPCLRAKPFFPLEQTPASALPAAWLRQARATLVGFGFPFKKEAVSPTSGLVRSTES